MIFADDYQSLPIVALLVGIGTAFGAASIWALGFYSKYRDARLKASIDQQTAALELRKKTIEVERLERDQRNTQDANEAETLKAQRSEFSAMLLKRLDEQSAIIIKNATDNSKSIGDILAQLQACEKHKVDCQAQIERLENEGADREKRLQQVEDELKSFRAGGKS